MEKAEFVKLMIGACEARIDAVEPINYGDIGHLNIVTVNEPTIICWKAELHYWQSQEE